MFAPDDLEPETAAYHEAGHAFFAHRLGGRVLEVTIEGDDGVCSGRTSVQWRGLSRREHGRRSALVALGGPVAEAIWLGDFAVLSALSAWRADWREVEAGLALYAPAGEAAALLQRWLTEVRRELADPAAWEQLCRIADALSAHGTLDADLFAEAVGADDPD